LPSTSRPRTCARLATGSLFMFTPSNVNIILERG
jgi:hypothetical protein